MVGADESHAPPDLTIRIDRQQGFDLLRTRRNPGLDDDWVGSVELILIQIHDRLTYTLLLMGVAAVLFTPLMLLIPQFAIYINATPAEASVFFEKQYPSALK